MLAPTAFFDRTYDEALALLVETRDYVAYGQERERHRLDVWARAGVALETTRVTSRLGHVMAWLLARKAVLAGELTPAEAARAPYALERDPRLEAEGPVLAPLPPDLESLMARSLKLYVRIARLDELARREALH